MLPQVLAKPWPAEGVVGPDRIAVAIVAYRGRLTPEIGVVMRNPAVGAIVYLRGFSAVDRELLDELEKGQGAVGKIGDLRRPVIHLRVDVDRPIAAPGRAHQLVPDPLKIRGLTAGP